MQNIWIKANWRYFKDLSIRHVCLTQYDTKKIFLALESARPAPLFACSCPQWNTFKCPWMYFQRSEPCNEQGAVHLPQAIPGYGQFLITREGIIHSTD